MIGRGFPNSIAGTSIPSILQKSQTLSRHFPPVPLDLCVLPAPAAFMPEPHRSAPKCGAPVPSRRSVAPHPPAQTGGSRDERPVPARSGSAPTNSWRRRPRLSSASGRPRPRPERRRRGYRGNWQAGPGARRPRSRGGRGCVVRVDVAWRRPYPRGSGGGAAFQFQRTPHTHISYVRVPPTLPPPSCVGRAPSR